MTAIIAILNKSAVAISADSAVTIGTESSRKVYNYANKLFNLSVGNPVGVTVYNNAEFCGLPWETIIKLYRKHSSNKTLPRVLDYRDHFIEFLRFCTSKFFDGSEEDTSVKTITKSTIASVDTNFITAVKRRYEIDDEEELLAELRKLSDSDRRALHIDVASQVLESTLKILLEQDYHPGFSPDDIEYIKSRYERIIKTAVVDFLESYALHDRAEFVTQLYEIVLQAIVKTSFFEPTSGLVFTGFGEDEIFPALHALQVGCVINGKIRHLAFQDYSITQKKVGAIFPFAQTDIMQTFIEGLDPQLKANFNNFMRSALSELKDYVVSSIDGSTEAEKKLIATLDQKLGLIMQTLSNQLDLARRKLHINPMIAAISSLSKEDLAAMAESLINATYLHRRASFAEESVGGPVDVAVITKGDGFIWIKRKHYFDAALNLNYTAEVISKRHQPETR